MPDTQTIRVMELWREVINMAIQDEDYEALQAMPVDLFILLGMDDPYVHPHIAEGYIFASGCKRTSPAYQDD